MTPWPGKGSIRVRIAVFFYLFALALALVAGGMALIGESAGIGMRVVLATLGSAGVGVALATFLSLSLNETVAAPVVELEKAMNEAAEKKGLERPCVDVSRQDEPDGVLARFKEFADSVERREDALMREHEKMERKLAARSYRLERAERDLENYKACTEALGHTRPGFLANMSHEIRTPLNGILGMTELLLATDLDPQQKRFAQTIHLQGQNLAAIVSDVLDFSAGERGHLDLGVIEIDTHLAIDEVVGRLRGLAESKGLLLTIELTPGVPERVQTDPVRFRQILSNLLENAVKYTESGRVDIIALRDRTTISGERLRIEVKDTGIGIEERLLPKIFEAFVRGDTSPARRFGGTGLGLAVCKQLVQLLGGEIGVESEPGKGSRFWFAVPLEPAPRKLDLVIQVPETGARLAPAPVAVSARTSEEPSGSGLEPSVLGNLRALGPATGDAFISRLVTLFISDTERLLREMRAAFESGDVETLARLAHRLKSGSANVGALGMSAACKRMQNLATTPQAAEVLEELERMFLEVRPLLEAESKRV